MTPEGKKLKLLLHAQDGSFPYLSEYLLRTYFNPDDKGVKDHLVLGIAVKDTCVVPFFKPKERKKLKRKRSAAENDATKTENSSSSNNKNNSITCKPSGYTFDSESLDKQTRLLPGYQTFALPTFDLVDDATALARRSFKKKQGDNQQQEEKKITSGNIDSSVPSLVSASSTNDKLSLNTPNGMQQITPELYTEVAKKMKCHSVLALYDQTHSEEKKKRKASCKDRTKSWLERCLVQRKDEDCTTPLWGALSGIDTDDSVKESLQYLSNKQNELAGVTLIGWHHVNSREERMKLVKKCKDSFRVDMGLAITSASNLQQILDAIEFGITIIGTALPATWARASKAFVLDVGSGDSILEKIPSSSSMDENGCIDLSREKYARDSSPLLSGSDSCPFQNYTRSYVHHLIKANELLAEIILFGHNLHQMLMLFQKLSPTKDIEANQ